MRRTKEEADQTRKKLIENALESFSEKGYESTRLEDIARKAGVTRGAIYWHFKNKDDLIIAVHTEFAENIYNIVETEFERGGSPLDSFIRVFKRIAYTILEDPHFRAISTLERYYYRKKDIFEAIKLYHQKHTDYLLEKMQKHLVDAKESGEIDPELNSRDILTAMATMLKGIVSTNFKAVLPESISRPTIDTIAIILRRGIAAA